jgi:hypothetical protein
MCSCADNTSLGYIVPLDRYETLVFFTRILPAEADPPPARILPTLPSNLWLVLMAHGPVCNVLRPVWVHKSMEYKSTWAVVT